MARLRQPPPPLLVHFRVLRALFRREMLTRFGRTPGGYLWAFFEPLAVIAVLTTVFSLLANLPPLGSSFVLFFATGYIGFSFYRATADFASGAVQYNKALLNYPSVTPFDTVLTRTLLQGVTNYAVSLILFSSIFIVLDLPANVDILLFFATTLGAITLGFGMATLNSVLFMLYPIYERIFGIVNRPLLLISGVFFIPEDLPGPVQDALFINPIAHYICLMRMAFYPEYHSTFVSLEYIWFFTLGVTAIGLAVLTRHRHRFNES